LKGQDTKGREIVVVPHELDLIGETAWVNSNSKDYAHDLAIEVHLNAGGGTGTETYYGLKQLSDEVNAGIVEVMGLKNRGSKKSTNLGWNNDTKMGSCLVELGFIDNANDLAVIRDRGAKALANGILKACGSVWKDTVTTPSPTPQPTPSNPCQWQDNRINELEKGLQDQINEVNRLTSHPDCTAIQTVLDNEVEKLRLCEIDKIKIIEELRLSNENPQIVEKVVVREATTVGEVLIQLWNIIKGIK
jgi:hypothetical protein